MIPFPFAVREERGTVGGRLWQLVLQSHIQVEPAPSLLPLLLPLQLLVWGSSIFKLCLV